MTPALFDRLPNGQEVYAVELAGGGLTARVLTFGATVQDLRMKGVSHPLVLGCPGIAPYLGDALYVGALVGRFANRIGGAGFSIDGTAFRTDANQQGRHTLHGGTWGMGQHSWDITDLRDDAVQLSLRLPDGDMGFPGNLDLTARIALQDSALCILVTAETDAPTPCSIAHHGYFNLDGAADIREHQLQIAAEHYLPVDADLIPTGQIAPLAGTRFDFRQPRPIGAGGYDHNFCLSDDPRPLRPVARLTGTTGISMQVQTTACGLQVYDGGHFRDLPGLDGRIYGAHAGIALETQAWPDAPNRPEFPGAILSPGQTYREETRYVFTPA